MENLFESDIYVLAIETSTRNGSLAILRNTEEIGGYHFSDREVVSQFLLVGITNLLSELDLCLRDIGLIAVSEGPGSLTGIRVGLSAGKGLSNSLGIKCIGAGILEAMRATAKDGVSLCCLVDNGNGKYIWNLNHDGQTSEICYGNLVDFRDFFEKKKVSKLICDRNAAHKIQLNGQTLEIVDNLAARVGVSAFKIFSGSITN